MKDRYMLKELPDSEKPRERALNFGVSSLADYELLAIILTTGSSKLSVLDLARNITISFNSISDLADISIEELLAFDGIGKAKAISILAAIELGRRSLSSFTSMVKITKSSDIYQYMLPKTSELKQETLFALFLKKNGELIGEKIITIGTLDRTIFHPREVIKWALKHSSYALVIVHNHPSGDATPSEVDIVATKDLLDACKTVGLVLIDHLIMGKKCYYSFGHKKIFWV